MNQYNEFSYLWPPRPENKISKTLLSYYEEQGWIAQIKMNGTCSVIAVAPDRKTIKAMSRHNDDHKLWAPSAHTSAPFKNLPGNGWYVFVAELMHSKVPGMRDINYIHDVLVANGEYLVGKTCAERQALLCILFEVSEKNMSLSHYVIDDHTWLVRNHTEDFSALFESLGKPEYEGLVLKNPEAKLERCSRETSNRGWQVKCRKPQKNYGF
jgi:hypothetical protein